MVHFLNVDNSIVDPLHGDSFHSMTKMCIAVDAYQLSYSICLLGICIERFFSLYHNVGVTSEAAWCIRYLLATWRFMNYRER